MSDINVDINDLLKNKKSRKPSKIVIYTIVGLSVVIAGAFVWRSLKGTHNKIEPVETNIPADTAKSHVTTNNNHQTTIKLETSSGIFGDTPNQLYRN